MAKLLQPRIYQITSRYTRHSDKVEIIAHVDGKPVRDPMKLDIETLQQLGSAAASTANFIAARIEELKKQAKKEEES